MPEPFIPIKPVILPSFNEKEISFSIRFFTVKETPKHGRKVEYNQESIDTYRKNRVGWFVLATNDVKDPVKALEIYRMKDAIE